MKAVLTLTLACTCIAGCYAEGASAAGSASKTDAGEAFLLGQWTERLVLGINPFRVNTGLYERVLSRRRLQMADKTVRRFTLWWHYLRDRQLEILTWSQADNFLDSLQEAELKGIAQAMPRIRLNTRKTSITGEDFKAASFTAFVRTAAALHVEKIGISDLAALWTKLAPNDELRHRDATAPWESFSNILQGTAASTTPLAQARHALDAALGLMRNDAHGIQRDPLAHGCEKEWRDHHNSPWARVVDIPKALRPDPRLLDNAPHFATLLPGLTQQLPEWVRSTSSGLEIARKVDAWLALHLRTLLSQVRTLRESSEAQVADSYAMSNATLAAKVSTRCLEQVLASFFELIYERGLAYTLLQLLPNEDRKHFANWPAEAAGDLSPLAATP